MPRLRTRFVAPLLFLSGLCALLFQTAWLRELRLIFGASTPASAAVLAIFMGGLGLGNALLGPRADRERRPLRWYAQLELGICLATAASPLLIDLVRWIYVGIGGQSTLGAWGATMVRLLLSSLVLAAPTILMGGTLPAVARAVLNQDDDARHDVGWLYGLNTLGAVVGALLGTFVLFEAWGTRMTLWAGCGVNLLLALVAWRLAQTVWFPEQAADVSPPVPMPAPSATPTTTSSAPGKKRKPADTQTLPPQEREIVAPAVPSGWVLPPGFLYAAAAGVGGLFFLMELVWYRMLSPILGGSTFTFGLILAVVLAGIGLGGAAYPLLYRRRRPTLCDLSLTCALEALCIIIPFALGDRLAILAIVLRDLAALGFSGQVLGWTVVATIIVFPAAFVSGIQFPILIALVGEGRQSLGKQVGYLFAWNTVGAMVGSLVGGFGALPLFTAPGLWRLVAVALAVAGVGMALVGVLRQRSWAWALPMIAGSLAAVGLNASGPSAVWRHGGIGAGRAQPEMTAVGLHVWINDTRRAVTWESDGREASVAFNRADGLAFFVNGKSDGNALGDAPTQIMLGVLGAVLHPEPKTAFVVGLGTGESAGWLAEVETIERVDVAELEPDIAHMAQRCSSLNFNVLSHPKVKITYNDAREMLLSSRARYDLIVSEPSNPYRSGVANLFTREFYAAARSRLQDGGLFVQWLQGYEIDALAARTVFATLHQEFPHVEVWQSKVSDLLLVCSVQPLTYSAAELRERLQRPSLKRAAATAWRATDVETVLGHFIAGAPLTSQIAADPPVLVNTDDLNHLEYGAARSVGAAGGFESRMLRALAEKHKHHRPSGDMADIDWERVLDAAIALYAFEGGEGPVLPNVPAAHEARGAAIRHFAKDRYEAILPTWKTQSRQPQTPTELVAVARGLIEARSKECLPLIEQLREYEPLEADSLMALHLLRQHDIQPAVEIAGRTLEKLRSRAWPQRTALTPLLDAVFELGQVHPKSTLWAVQVLSQDYDMDWAVNRRHAQVLTLAESLPDDLYAKCLSLDEPYPRWNGRLLQQRAEVYAHLRHPLAAQAQRDWQAYQQMAPRSRLLAE